MFSLFKTLQRRPVLIEPPTLGKPLLANGQAVATKEASQHWKPVFFTGLALALILFVYNIPEPYGTTQHSRLYLHLARAFVAGHTYLQMYPSQAMSEAFERKDYETALRMEDRGVVVWNASLYKGKWYYYYGPTPALICAAWVPFNDGVMCSDALLGKAAAVGVVIFFFLIAEQLAILYGAGKRRWLLWFIAIIFTFGGIQMYMMGGELYTGIYHASILANVCFLMGGTFFYLRYVTRGRLSDIVLVNVFFALAVSSKVTAIIFVFFVSLAIVLREALSIKRTGRDRFVWALLAFTPMVVTGIALLLYNKARFDSYLEFGIKYVYDEVFVREAIDSGNLYALSNIPRNVFIYFFKVNQLDSKIPYIRLIVDDVAHNYWTISIFLLAPVLVLSLATFLFPQRVVKRELWWFFVPIFVGMMINIGNYLVWFGSVLRYTYEFVPFLYIFAFVALLRINNIIRPDWWARSVYAATLTCVGAWSLFAGYAMLMASTWGNR